MYFGIYQTLIFGAALVLTVSILPRVQGGECGGFLELSEEAYTGNISTPNYPNNYPDWTQCMWLIQAEKEYSVVLNVGTLALQQDGSGQCLDYIEVRNGSSTEELLYQGCTGSGVSIPAGYRWIWIKFYSDHATSNTGFMAHYTMESLPGVINTPNPWSGCDSYNYKCGNKECISQAYRCDGYMDCGCEGSGCDEYGCNDPGWDETLKLGVGIGVGTFIFLCVFLGIGFGEICMKKYAEASYKRKMADQKKRAKQKKGEKAIENLAASMNGGSRRSSSLGRRDSLLTAGSFSAHPTPMPKTPITPATKLKGGL